MAQKVPSHRKFHHERVHYAADDGDEIKNVPAVFEVALKIGIFHQAADNCQREDHSTYRRSVRDELETALDREAHGEGEVHVAEDVGQQQGGAVILKNKGNRSVCQEIIFHFDEPPHAHCTT
jgi:hypothetical protein